MEQIKIPLKCQEETWILMSKEMGLEILVTRVATTEIHSYLHDKVP